MKTHTVTSFDEELNQIERQLSEMGGLAETAVQTAVDALKQRSTALAHQVIATDPRLDALQRALEEQAVVTIAKRQPVAADLRVLVTAMRVAGDLERVGDLAKNIAKRALVIEADLRTPRLLSGLENLASLSHAQLKHVLDAYMTRDAGKAFEVWNRDEQVDTLHNSVFRELLTYMMEDPRNIGLCTHLLFCAKNLERIGDHATNIAENVYFLATGKSLDLDRPRADGTAITAGSDGR